MSVVTQNLVSINHFSGDLIEMPVVTQNLVGINHLSGDLIEMSVVYTESSRYKQT